MRITRFTHGGSTRLGVVLGNEVADLGGREFPTDLPALLADGAVEAASVAASTASRLALEEVRLEAPVARPPEFLAVGLNYRSHAAETGQALPTVPVIFNKQSSCVTGPADDVWLPRVAPDLVDYEGELGFVIGRRCRHVPKDRAAHVIAGFLVVNDVSVRDWQMASPTWTMGKSFDTHGPIGPWLATPDEVGDPHALSLKTWVNGELRQEAKTDDLVFDCYDLVAHLSTAFTLEPGTIVSTGTPSGVGVARTPPSFLSPGDVVRIEIERIGAIENRIVAEPDHTALP
ncbi:MAG TPA: fumarylacetoacetate hydrolase family protein [Acidimicrobiales bacterium]|nr:fumarylacetoacetate hydrolase family protein [Acidimicrobiales bacterium]